MPEKLDFSEAPDTGTSATDWFQGFGKSALESIPEMIGINPSTQTQAWRQDHPVGDVASQLLGLAVPYTGWFKAIKGVKSIEGVAKSFEAMKSPIVGGALGTATRLAPLEAGRIAANQVVGDQTLTQMVGETATDLALMSGIGGLLHGVAAAGLRDPKLPTVFPGIDVSLPLPLLARQMRDIIDSGKIADPEMLGRAKYKLNETLNAARIETLPRNHDYVGPIAHDYIAPDGKTDTIEHQLNRLFRMEDSPNKLIRVRKFAAGAEKDFESKLDWQTEAKEAGLPDGFEEHGQYFRNVSFRPYTPGQTFEKSEKAALKNSKIVNDVVTKNMQSVGDGNFIAREADEGMFVIARKYEGDVKKGTTDDKWVLFKTDKPGYFLPDQDKWAKYQVSLAKWAPNADVALDAGPVYNALQGYKDLFPLRNWIPLATGGASALKNTITSLLPQNVIGKNNELVQRMGDAVSEYLTPRIFQFKKSWRANWIVNGAKTASDAADTTANELMYGKLKVDPGNNLFFNALRKGQTNGIDGLTPVKQIFDGVSQGTVDEFIEKVWRPRVSPAELDGLMTSGEITPETSKFAKAMEAVSDWKNTTTQQVEEATGRKPTEFPTGTYGLNRYWEGDTRIVLKNDAGQVVAHAAGPNRKTAQKFADRLIKENPGWSIDREVSISQEPAGLAKFLADKDTSLTEDQNLRGFKWDLENPTKDDLLKDYDGQIRKQMKYQANLSVGDLLTSEMTALMREDPVAYNLAKTRLGDYAGVQSTFGKWQNQIADQVLGPVLGPNSASKIVGLTNTAMFDLTLGAMKLSYPVINALQFVQTVIPEAAFVLGKAPPENLAHKYSFFAAGGTKGPIGGMGVLNPLKMMYSAGREMGSPSAELSSAFERAANDRVIDPRMVEDYIGASAAKVSDLKSVLKGDQSFVSWLRALSEFLPAETERFSRTHAFTVGYSIARDFLKTAKGTPLSADHMYQFARQFTENTMYLYGTADKARVFTTPAGSALGLFKNWMFHYIASMGDYTSQGFTKNNWAPLMWQMGGTMALGGLSAMPLFGAANSFSKLWSDKSVLQQSYDHFGQGADYMLYGIPALMNVSMTSGVDTPALSNPVRDGSSLFSVAAWGRMQALGKSVGGAFDNWQATGQHPGADRATRENLVKAFAPVTMYRSLAAFADPNAIISLGTGYPLEKDPSLAHKLLYSAGFTPTELQRGYDISTALYETHDALKTEEAKLSKAWAEAEMNGDSATMATIMRQGMTWGVDVSRVIKGGIYELEKHRRDIIERHLKPRDIGAYRKAILGGKENGDTE